MVGGLMGGFFLLAKEVMELLGPSQSTFGDLVGELGLSEALRAESAYTLLAPFNAAFTGEFYTLHYL